MSRCRPIRTFAPALALLAAAACGKNEPTGPRTVTSLVVSGGGQSGPVGSILPVKITVTASDSRGPISGAAVHAAPSNSGSGSVAPENATTDASGIATFTWTLGGQVGAQALTFTSGSVTPATASATGQIGPPASILAVSDIFQLTVVSRLVTSVPTVQVSDAFGNPIAGVEVTFAPTVSGSTLTGATQVTNTEGKASVGSWQVGPAAISYGLRASIAGGAVAIFEARGVPAAVVVLAGNNQSANVGTAAPVAPAVRATRDDGSPLPGVTVTFLVTSGTGVVQDATPTTGSDGVARPTRWILGLAPGANLVEARVSGRDPVVFSATGLPAAPATGTAVSPAAQSAFFGNFVASPPAILVRDLDGNPVAGVPVTFSITQGDGQLTGASQASDFLGRATLSAWRLGNASTHAVSASAAGLPPVTFTVSAAAAPPSSFQLVVRYVTQPSPSQQAAFEAAAARWRQVLIAGGAPYPINEAAFGPCPAMNETVPGLVIFADVRTIDGPGNILGQAGPCILRDDPFYLPAMGIMQFDVADLASLESQGRLNDVILHEMGHVLGFGTIWNFLTNSFLTGAGGGDPFFNGTSARSAFLASVASGRSFTGSPVPVENSGGAGTRDSHWREVTVTTELMTGFVSPPGTANPLSAFTAAMFRDLGYTVNDAVADPFTFLATVQAGAAPAQPAAGSLQLIEGRIDAPMVVVNRQGKVVARVARY